MASETASAGTLAKLEAKLDEYEVELKKWNKKVDGAPLFSSEREEYKKERDIYLSRVQALEAQIKEEKDRLIQAAQAVSVRLAPIHKRLKGPEDGVGLFVANTLVREFGPKKSLVQKMELIGPIDDPERILDLASKLNEDKVGPMKIVVRACHGKLADLIIASLNKDQDVLLAGSRGTGKSVLGSLIAVLLALKGELVIYQHKTNKVVLVGETLTAISLAALVETCTIEEYDVDSFTPGGWKFASGDVDFLSRLSKKQGVTVVHDIGDDPVPFIIDGKSRRLIVSSPNSEKLKPLRSYPNFKRFYMALWLLEELFLARAQCYPDTVDEPTVKTRFGRMDGVPRYTIAAEPGVAEKLQDTQIRNVPISSIKNAFLSSDFTQLQTQAPKDASGNSDAGSSTDLIFKLVPTEDFLDFQIQFASDYVASKLADRFVEEGEAEMREFAFHAKCSGDLGSFRGHFVEAYAHKVLREGVNNVELRELFPSGTTHQPSSRTVSLPQLPETLFNPLEDLKSIVPNQYCRPTTRNFESVDSFSVLLANLFDPTCGPNEFALVGFQMAVGQKHSVNGSGVKRVSDHVSTVVTGLPAPPPPVHQSKARNAKAPPAPVLPVLPIFLVFVVDSNRILDSQPIVRDSGDNFVYTNFVKKQYSLTLGPGFDNLTKMSKQWLS